MPRELKAPPRNTKEGVVGTGVGDCDHLWKWPRPRLLMVTLRPLWAPLTVLRNDWPQPPCRKPCVLHEGETSSAR